MAESIFVNPYNFIPLQEKAPDRGKVKHGNLTGVINVSLLTRTPLIIPNTTNSDAFDMAKFDGHKSYDFYSYEDLREYKGSREGQYAEPVIPGSAIRGMMRSNFEILTNSCMSFVDDEEVLSKRTNEPFTPGLIERTTDGKYILYKAKDCLARMKNNDDLSVYNEDESPDTRIKSFKNRRVKEGQKVFVKVIERERNLKPIIVDIKLKHEDGLKTGYIIKGEVGPRKHNCYVFLKGKQLQRLSSEEVDTLSTILNIYKDSCKNNNSGHNGYNEYRTAWGEFEGGKGEELFPVYFSRLGEPSRIMMSPACITREIYSTRLREILGEHKACNKKDKLCPACKLFGTIGENFQIKSRIRMSDMRLSERDAELFSRDRASLYEKTVTLEPLSTPKLNNMEFYIKKPADDAWFWTYDYYIDSKGDIHMYRPEINGRKFYWHQPEMSIKSVKPSNQNTTVRPLRNGVRFIGKVFFENLTKEELNQLVFVINAGDEDDVEIKTHCYKLGHAKPLGYGSVAMHVDNVEIRSIVIDDNSGSIDYEIATHSTEAPFLHDNYRCDFDKMTDFMFLKGRKVGYPKSSPSDKGYSWFVDNHGRRQKVSGMPRSRKEMTYKQHMYSLEPDLKPTGAPMDEPPNKGKRYRGNKNR